MTQGIDNSPTAGARVAMAQMDRLQRAQSANTNKVASSAPNGDTTRSAAFKLASVADGGRLKGMTFIAMAGQMYEVEAFGGFAKVAPKLTLELPSGEMVSEQSSGECVSFKAVVSIGEKGGDVNLIATGGELSPGLFFMRATAI